MADGDWKNVHANTACNLAKHPIVERVLDEFSDNMGFERKGLPGYGLSKIVNYVAQVVLARALNIDPEALCLSAEEVSEQQMKIIEAAYRAGVPTFIVAPPPTTEDAPGREG